MSSSTTPTMETGSVQVCVQPRPRRVDSEVNSDCSFESTPPGVALLPPSGSLMSVHAPEYGQLFPNQHALRCSRTASHFIKVFQMKRGLRFRIMNRLSGASDRFVSNIRRKVEYYLVSNGNRVSLPAPL